MQLDHVPAPLSPSTEDTTYAFGMAINAYRTAFPDHASNKAEGFAQRIVQLWPHCKAYYPHVEQIITAGIRLARRKPAPPLCLHNLRALAGVQPKLSKRLQARL